MVCWLYTCLIFVTSTTSGARGEKICHVEKFLHMTYCHLERFSTWQIDMWKKFSIWEMWRKSVKWRNRLSYLWCFNAYYAVLLQNLLILRFTLFCRKICFVAIYALLRGEKLSKKLCPWRKKDKYHVCFHLPFLGGSEPPSAGFKLPEAEAPITMWLSKQKAEL